jgi:ATP-dependent Zn protease
MAYSPCRLSRAQESLMKEPRASSLDELKQIEAEMTENKASLHGLVNVITGDHPTHGFTIVVRDESSGYVFATPIPAEAV